jgi:hypothetical protein
MAGDLADNSGGDGHFEVIDTTDCLCLEVETPALRTAERYVWHQSERGHKRHHYHLQVQRAHRETWPRSAGTLSDRQKPRAANCHMFSS